MKTYLISYDLLRSNPFVAYENLREAIKRSMYWAKPLESVFIIKTTLTAIEVAKALQPYLDPTDKLLVVEIGKDWGSINMSSDVVNWLKNNV